MIEKKELLASLPKVDALLNEEKIVKFVEVSRTLVVESIRETLETYRKKIISGIISQYSRDSIIEDILKNIDKKMQPHLKRVINGTGTIFHTNLGRAVLAKSAVNAVISIAERYNNLEFELESGERGSRYSHVEELLCKITGAEAAIVVNNNAAAVMLVLATLSKGREAIVSRGQLVEIGGSFRVPSVMEQSGARLVEVGTTNRTHLYDYENAINDNTGVILRVHQSNYKIMGFTEDVEIEVLVNLGKKRHIPIIEDIGSGVFIDLSKYGLTYEPTVQHSVKKGIDVVTFSGDKMLGGPQAGIIVGKKYYIDMMKKNQLTRALRIDKMTLAALEATLRLYSEEERAIREIPGLNMLTKSMEELRKNASRLARLMKVKLKERVYVEIIEDYSQVGGGAMPLEKLKTYAVALKFKDKSIEEVDKELRQCEIPIITRLFRDRMLLDVRTLFEDEYRIIVNTFDRLI